MNRRTRQMLDRAEHRRRHDSRRHARRCVRSGCEAIAGLDWCTADDFGWYDCESGHRFRRKLPTHLRRRQPAPVRRNLQRLARKRQRDREKYIEWTKRVGTKPRTRMHRTVRITPELRAAWASVRMARRADAVLRRTQRFVNLLLDHTRDDGDRTAPARCYLRLDRSGDLDRQPLGGGMINKPAIVDEHLGSNTLGQYRCGIRNGFSIALDVEKHRRDYMPALWLDVLRATVVHELLHLLDSEARIDDHGHDGLWSMRLRRMFEMLPPEQYGRAADATLRTEDAHVLYKRPDADRR